MRVPFTVGRWVRGDQHYGRERPIRYLLTAPDNAYWVVGTRRMGKTSLLRQLELLTSGPDSLYFPLFWDLQGSETPSHLAEELSFAIDDAHDRLAALRIDPTHLADSDAVTGLRRLQRAVADRGMQLLLLIDEAEALIGVGESDLNWLARLRKAFQSEHQRTVLTATKLLSKLNDLQSQSMTSPFLFGFNLVNLWALDPDDGHALVCQSQSEHPVEADQSVIDAILHHTNHHPYLTQFLCQRVFVMDGEQATLRPVEDEDLIPDQLLSGFFNIDFLHLSHLEREIMLAVAELRAPTERELITALGHEAPNRIRTFVYGLHKLGYVRPLDGKWTVGNEFLRRWLRDNRDQLAQVAAPAVSDYRVEELLERGVGQELSYLQSETRRLQARLLDLQTRQGPVATMPEPEIQREIARAKVELAVTERNLILLANVHAQRI